MKKITLFIAMLLLTALNYSAQAVESQTVACTAGNLATLADGYKATVTNLTVTGTIDARDFKTMRDDMPLLEVIDLSGTTVEAYSGTAGTGDPQGPTIVSYPANAIPTLAFCNPSSYTGKMILKTFIYPALAEAIGNYAFYTCRGLTGSLIIPSTVTVVGFNAFAGCTGLNGSLTISSSATTIGLYAFSDCSGLTGSLTIPSSVTTIGSYAFQNCSGFKGTLTIPESVTTIGDLTFWGCSGLTGSLTIPSSVTSIGSLAFYRCFGFTGSLTIPPSVTTIGSMAFYNCSGLTGSATIPATVETIGHGAFCLYGGLIEVDEANPNYSSVDGVFFNKNKTTLIQYPIAKSGNYLIPSSVSTIGMRAFYICTNLTGTLTIPTTVTTIEDEAFAGCHYLKGSLTIPSSVTTIGWAAFAGCSGFKGTLTIPSSVTKIDDEAFKYCSGLTGPLTIPPSVTSIGVDAFLGCSGFSGSLTIPSSVTSIGNRAFLNCSGITSIYSSATAPVDISNIEYVFDGIVKSTCILHVPVSSKPLYASAKQWKDFTNIVDDIVATSIEEVYDSGAISIFPNPATSSITVSELSSLVNDKTVTLSVTDVSGSTLFTQEVEPSIGKFTLDVSSFKSGIYFVAIETSNGRVVKRFVKE